MLFKKKIDEFNSSLNNIRFGRDSKFCNRSMKS